MVAQLHEDDSPIVQEIVPAGLVSVIDVLINISTMKITNIITPLTEAEISRSSGLPESVLQAFERLGAAQRGCHVARFSDFKRLETVY